MYAQAIGCELERVIGADRLERRACECLSRCDAMRCVALRCVVLLAHNIDDNPTCLRRACMAASCGGLIDRPNELASSVACGEMCVFFSHSHSFSLSSDADGRASTLDYDRFFVWHVARVGRPARARARNEIPARLGRWRRIDRPSDVVCVCACVCIVIDEFSQKPRARCV